MILQGTGNNFRGTGTAAVDQDNNRIVRLLVSFSGGKSHLGVLLTPFCVDNQLGFIQKGLRNFYGLVKESARIIAHIKHQSAQFSFGRFIQACQGFA